MFEERIRKLEEAVESLESDLDRVSQNIIEQERSQDAEISALLGRIKVLESLLLAR